MSEIDEGESPHNKTVTAAIAAIEAAMDALFPIRQGITSYPACSHRKLLEARSLLWAEQDGHRGAGADFYGRGYGILTVKQRAAQKGGGA